MLWIEEVEMVESVDHLKSSRSMKGTPGPDFELLDARIASALNRIIHNSHFKRMVSLEEQKGPEAGPFPLRKTDRLPDLRVLPGHWSQWFCRELCRPIYNCSSRRWYLGIRFEIGRNAMFYDENPIWWYLGRIVQAKNTRVWEAQDRIGIVWPGDSSSENRTWLSQIENDGEKKYRARFTKQEFWGQKRKLWNAVVKNQGTKQRGQKILGDCWQWETNGQCSKGDNCSFRHDFDKRAKMTQPNPSPSSFMQQNERNASKTRSPRGKSPSGRMSRWPCKDYLNGTCTNSFCEKWHPPECLFYKTKSGCRFGEKCSYAHRQVDE